MYHVHENETGLFQELARSNDIKFGQISLLIINSGCSRGGHFHARKEEWFCCIHGKCRIDLLNVHSKVTKEAILDDTKREFFKVEAFWSHTLTNLSDEKTCDIIVIVSEEFDESNPDTIRFEG
jgi:dTDP-4-dehydrorhamnose 3,5-epimerase-like enzyme